MIDPHVGLKYHFQDFLFNKTTRQYSMLPGIQMVPVSGQIKNFNFFMLLVISGMANKVFWKKAENSSFEMQVLAGF